MKRSLILTLLFTLSVGLLQAQCHPKFTGSNRNVVETCQTGVYQYTMNVTHVDGDTIVFDNLYEFMEPIIAILDCNTDSLTIPYQSVTAFPYYIAGNGYYDANSQSVFLAYGITDNDSIPTGDTCIASYNSDFVAGIEKSP